jgi:protein TonB
MHRPKPKPAQKSLAARAPATTAPASGASAAASIAPAPASATREPAAPGGAGVPGGLGSAAGGAQALYAPMPEIPADLRGSPLNTVAIARFIVASDGSATVTLVKTTPYPELNYLLLRTLRQWRFFPAVKDGKPVASNFQVRIPVVVE